MNNAEKNNATGIASEKKILKKHSEQKMHEEFFNDGEMKIKNSHIHNKIHIDPEDSVSFWFIYVLWIIFGIVDVRWYNW